RESVKGLSNNFKKFIKNGNLRIQIEIEPEVDATRNTGLPTGSFLLNMNLWIESKELPLGRFAENVVLEPQGIEKSDSLRICLEKEDLLPNLIRKARYSLPEPVKLAIEIFLPIDFYQESLERICFKSGRSERKPLGKEYSIFINSFERYFDEDFRESRDEIFMKKEILWKNDNSLDLSDIYYVGTKPSEEVAEMIATSKAIAVWSQCRENPLTKDNDPKTSKWKDWPQKIHNLRKEKNDMDVTLFWDDLYPKPSRRSRPLNTNVVE
ncbi:MAG: hypothetical protein PUP92_30040, partial [Rhizonema sp. PD38]|nr:hypothetical protein [Rhizonema sp. PD38]